MRYNIVEYGYNNVLFPFYILEYGPSLHLGYTDVAGRCLHSLWSVKYLFNWQYMRV